MGKDKGRNDMYVAIGIVVGILVCSAYEIGKIKGAIELSERVIKYYKSRKEEEDKKNG